MHFFYTDESGDTGRNLRDPDQPIMVMGGVNLRDQGWNQTQQQLQERIDNFFGGAKPDDFELHAYDLLSPAGGGPFAGYPIQDRADLAKDILQLIADRGHGTHLIAFDKERIHETACGLRLAYNPSRPYLLALDYLITAINHHVRNRLGQSARGLLVLDEKQNHRDDIPAILDDRRNRGAAIHRVKWIVDVGYSVESHRNPMVQIADLVVFCARRFLEIEHGHRPRWSPAAKQFYAECYDMIDRRLISKSVIERPGRGLNRLNDYIRETRVVPGTRWRQNWGL